MNILHTFLYYLKHCKNTILLLSVFLAIYMIVFSLYQIPLEAVSYASLLCICFGLSIFLIRFTYYYKKHVTLLELQQRITLGIEQLPAANQLIEQDYQQLLHVLYQTHAHFVSETDNAKSETMDYYTLWVHQIKTPISAMRLLLQTNEEANITDLSTELFKIEQYVEMVLSYLRLDSNSNDFVIKQYDLDSIIRQAIRKFAKQFIGKKIALDYKETHLQVLTDEKWLLFVIEQILSNGLKYTSKGKISIYAEQSSKTLIIQDTGIGISKEDLPRVFEKGYTGYNGRLDKKSTGIGLYLCKKTLNKLSHTITIESIVGEGTKVMITLDTISLFVE